MKQITITYGGKEYPCRQTMGAMLRFKRETGKEATEIKADSLSDLVTFLYCCVVSECSHQKIPFGFTLQDFADGVTLPDLNAWAAQIMQSGDGEGADPVKKK